MNFEKPTVGIGYYLGFIFSYLLFVSVLLLVSGLDVKSILVAASIIVLVGLVLKKVLR